MHDRQFVAKWWDAKGNSKVKNIFQVVPAIMLYYIWKRRKTFVYEGSYAYNTVIHDTNNNIVLE